MVSFFSTFFRAWGYERKIYSGIRKTNVLPGKLATLYIDGGDKGGFKKRKFDEKSLQQTLFCLADSYLSGSQHPFLTGTRESVRRL
jgi:hypothetical protein